MVSDNVVEIKEGRSTENKKQSFRGRVKLYISKRLTNTKIFSFQLSWRKKGNVTAMLTQNVVCIGDGLRDSSKPESL